MRFAIGKNTSVEALAVPAAMQYRSAARYSLKTLWQRTMMSSGVKHNNPIYRAGLELAAVLDNPPQPTTEGATPTKPPDIQDVRDAAVRHRTEKRDLTKFIQERKQEEARVREQEAPRWYNQLWAIFNRKYAEELRQQVKAAAAQLEKNQQRDREEKKALETRHTQEILTLHRGHLAGRQSAASNSSERLQVAREALVNATVLINLTGGQERATTSRENGLIYFAALAWGTDPKIMPVAATAVQEELRSAGEKKELAVQIAADSVLLSFGISPDSARRATQGLQQLQSTEPDLVREKARRVQILLAPEAGGFASAAGQLFNPGLPRIKAEIGPAIDTLAALPTTPANVVPITAGITLRA